MTALNCSGTTFKRRIKRWFKSLVQRCKRRELLDLAGFLQNRIHGFLQGEKLRLQREFEDRLEQSNVCYEERIVELHCVIAELRKKLDRHQINVIR